MKKRVRILMLFILFFSAVTPAYATVTSTIEASEIEEISGTQEQESAENTAPDKLVDPTTEAPAVEEDSATKKSDPTPTVTPISEAETTNPGATLKNRDPVARAVVDYGSQFFNDVSFSDMAGNTLAKVKDTDKIKVNYTFDITTPVKEGETMSIALPEELKLVNYTEFPLKDNDGNTIALATTDKNTGLITLTFTDYVNGKSAISGELFFWAKLDKTKVTDGNNTICMPVNGVTTDLTLKVSKTTGSTSGTTNPTVLFKSGAYDKNDPTLINWTITLNNANQNLFQPTIIDTIGPGQTLVKTSFVVNYRDAAKKSKMKYVLPTTLTNDRTEVSFTDAGFDLKLENLGSFSIINHYSSAVITYKTKVDNSGTQYINSASSADENNDSQTRNATVKFYGSGGEASGSVNEAIDEISNTIDEAESVDPNELTPLENTQLEESKNTAQTTLDNEDATIKELDKAKENLGETIQEVTPAKPEENQEVKEAIEKLKEILVVIEGKAATDYTQESWDVLEEVKEKAEVIVGKGTDDSHSVTVEEVTEIQKQLEEALTQLELIPTPETILELENLVIEADNKQKEDYTNETWVPFEESLELAKESLAEFKNDPQSVKNSDMEQITIQLEQAMSQLKKVESQAVELPIEPSENPHEQQGQFPATGEKHSYLIGLLGILVSTGSILIYRRRV
ncbi:Ig-like domain-containing protein [Carnobacterium maltaromaticum]|uniref:Ig-like domain-containing protein n=1 Tax=Carnobacterium maltaromaticum TaxID=2751 RepID=UPI0039AFB1B7